MPKVDNSIITLANFGNQTYKNGVRKFGRCEIGAVEAVVWDGNAAYDGWLDDEEDIKAVSTSLLDAPGEIGTSYLEFTGQGNDGIEKTYSMTLNGQTDVLLSSTDPGVKFNIIYTGQALNIEGTNKSPLVAGLAGNQGTITITSVTSGKVMAIILPNLARTQMMVWRCPKDHYGEFDKISIYPVSGKPMVAKLMARDVLGVSWICVGQIDILNDIASITHPFPDYISPGTDLALIAIAEQTGTSVSAQMWIEKFKIPNYDTLLAEEIAG